MSDTLKERLHEAGSRFDGHVTNGSLAEQIKVVEAEVRERKWRAQVEMFDRFLEAAALRGIPAGHHTPASLLNAVERAARFDELDDLVGVWPVTLNQIKERRDKLEV